MAKGPYSRFYWEFTEEYQSVYDDKPTLGWWLTLLVIAEGAHPNPGNLPAGLPKRALSKLVDAGLVELGTSFRFRIRGVTAERARRSESARVAGLASARSRYGSTPVERPVERRLNLDETSRAETRKDETRRGSTGLSPIEFGPFGLVKEGERHD